MIQWHTNWYLGVNVELGEVLRLSGSAVAMSEGTQALQPLGHDAGKSLLSGEFRDEEDVLGSTHLVGSVGTTCMGRWEEGRKIRYRWEEGRKAEGGKGEYVSNYTHTDITHAHRRREGRGECLHA